MSALLFVLRWSVTGLLVLFMVRRYVLIIASAFPARLVARDRTRSIVLLVAGRNEAQNLPVLFSALEQLDYPSQLVHIVLVSDGSDDDTARLMHAWTTSPFATEVLVLPQSLGKGGALAAGLVRAGVTDLVAVLDADCVPEPDVLQLFSGAFSDARVGAVTGYPRPANANTNVVARYAALERWAHHLVVLAGKDRLGLDPSIVGVAFAVRRTALDSAGGFPVGRLAEDTELSMAVVAAGWRLRWLGAAIVREDVPEDFPTFHAQRNRWGRGMLQSAHRARSLEDLFVVTGYLDRVAWVLAILLVPFGLVSAWLPAVYVVAPALSVMVALRRAGARPATSFLWAAGVMVAADLAVSVRSAMGHLSGSRVTWGSR